MNYDNPTLNGGIGNWGFLIRGHVNPYPLGGTISNPTGNCPVLESPSIINDSTLGPVFYAPQNIVAGGLSLQYKGQADTDWSTIIPTVIAGSVISLSSIGLIIKGGEVNKFRFLPKS